MEKLNQRDCPRLPLSEMKSDFNSNSSSEVRKTEAKGAKRNHVQTGFSLSRPADFPSQHTAQGDPVAAVPV